MDPNTPYTPGSQVVFEKPNIPFCWTPEPAYTVDEPTNSEEVNENA